MKNFLLNMFSDHSAINPKVVTGFISFIAMIIYGMTDVVTGAMGKAFVVEPIVFNGLMYTTFGCLGISGVETIFGNKNLKKETQESVILFVTLSSISLLVIVVVKWTDGIDKTQKTTKGEDFLNN